MKNLNHLTYHELLRYLDLTSTDPAIRRLVELLYADNACLFQELVDAGMDPISGMFDDSWESYSPKEYIEHLRNEVDYYSSEVDERQYELERAEAKAEALQEKIKVWTIMESK